MRHFLTVVCKKSQSVRTKKVVMSVSLRAMAFVLALLTLVILSPTFVSLAAEPAGTVDRTFKSGSGANSVVRTVALQPDGKILVGGNFTAYSTYNTGGRNYIARLNSDGTLDNSFATSGSGLNAVVNNIVVQPDGKILVGGNFTTYNSTSVNRLARLNSDGTLDTSFNPGGTGFNGVVNALALQSDGKIVVVGTFTTYNGTTRNRITRINSDGLLDTTLNPGNGADGSINTLAIQSDGKIVVGGTFNVYNATVRTNLARLNANGASDTTFNPAAGPNAGVEGLTIQSDGKIVIVGSFNSYNGTASNYIARLNADATLDNSFNSGNGFDFTPSKVVIQSSGKILVGGFFTNYNGTGVGGVVLLNTDGTLDTTFNPGGIGANSGINVVTVQPNGKLIIGGDFASYNGMFINRIARLNSDGTLDTTFNFEVNGVDPTNFNPSINAVAVQPDGKIIIGGVFNNYGGVVRNYLARLNSDGTLDTTFDPGGGPNNAVTVITLQPNGKILIGGTFGSYNGVNRSRLARLNSNGSLDTSFNPGTIANNTVNAIAVQPDSKIVIGGEFNGKIFRLNSNGSLDGTFNATAGNNSVYAIALQSDGKILIGGNFTTFNGLNRSSLVRVTATGVWDNTFWPGFANLATVKALAIQNDGKILVAGDISYYLGQTQYNNIGRLNTDASWDFLFNPGTSTTSSISSMVLQNDGRVLIGGDFLSYNNTPANRIARLNSDGSLELSFSSIVGNGPNNVVNAITLQPDGKIVIGGLFNAVDNYNRRGVARLEGIDPLASSVVLTSGFNPSEFGQSTTFTATLTPITATGTVQLAFGGSVNKIVTGTVVNGEATYITTTLPVGITPVIASYGGDAIFLASSSVPYSQTVNKATTSLSITSSPNPQIVGQMATFTATILPATATGTLIFTIGTAQVSAPLAGGVATYLTNTLASGSYSVSAAYGGSPTYSSSVSAGQYTHVVSPPIGTIQWESATYSVGEAGGTASLTATRSGGTNGAVSATVVITPGTATAADYSTPTSFVLSWAAGESGAKTFQLPIVNDVTYEGNENLMLGLANLTGGATLGVPAIASLTIVDNDLPATTVTLSSSPNPEQFGRTITLTVVVSAVAPATGAPTSGVVTFTEADGTTVLGTAQVAANGVATLTLSNLTAGNHTITAQYGGNANYLASPVSNSIVQVVKSSKTKF